MSSKKKKQGLGPSRLKEILKQVSGDAAKLEGDLIPPMAIRGTGAIYCYQPSTREIIKVTRGTKVFVIEEENAQGKVLIYTYQGYIVEIEAEELMHIGFD